MKRRTDQGFTLAELMVVLGLIAAIASVALAMIRKQDPQAILDASAKLVRANLRVARNSARKAGTAALVRISTTDRTVQAFPSDIGGNWHFEDMTGSRGSRISGAAIVPGGKLGMCARAGGAAIDLGDYPYFEAKDGFRFEVAIKPEIMGANEIINRPGAFRLALLESGGLVGEIHCGEGNETVRIETRGGLVRTGEWTRVAIAYDRLELALEANGVTYARIQETRPVNEPSGSLTLGGKGGLQGFFDEARLDVVIADAAEEINKRIDIAGQGDIVARFDELGRLDRRFHERPVEILMTVGEGEGMKKTVVKVDLSGVVE